MAYKTQDNPYFKGTLNWLKWERENGVNPFQEGTDLFNEWNALNPAAAKRAATAEAISPLTAYSPSFYSPEYGGIPAVADPTRSASNAIAGNQQNLAALQELATGVNTFNLGQQIGQYETALPGYGGMVAQSAGNIGSRLRGELPQDVVNQITQQAAERGVGLGVGGSPWSNAELVKSLGLTSLGLQTQAENELTNAIGRTPTVPLFNTAGFFVSPQEQQAAQQEANVMAAAPVPARAQQTALDIARAGIQAGASSVPIPQAPAAAPQTNSYSLVSDILSRYSGNQPTQTSYQVEQQPAQNLGNAKVPYYPYNSVPMDTSTWDYGGELGAGIPNYVSPPTDFDFSLKNWGL